MSFSIGSQTNNAVNKGKYERSKLCFVTHCFNSSLLTPDKHFIYVKKGLKRLAWLEAGKIKGERSLKTNMYCCQDHFDLEADFENDFHESIRIGLLPRLKPGVIPHLQLNLKPPTFNNEEIRNKRKITKDKDTQIKPNSEKEETKPSITEDLSLPHRFPDSFPNCEYLIPTTEETEEPETKLQKSKKPKISNLQSGKPTESTPLLVENQQHFLLSNKGTSSTSNQHVHKNKQTIPSRSRRNLNKNTEKKISDFNHWTSKIIAINKKQEKLKPKFIMRDELKQKFINTLDTYLETGIRLTPRYLQQSFQHFVNKNAELSHFKLQFFQSDWFDQFVNEHKDIASKITTPDCVIERKMKQLVLVAHMTTLRFIYKRFFGSTTICGHPERIYVLDEFILRTPSYLKPCKIDVTRGDVLSEEKCNSNNKTVTLLFGANTFGHKVPPVIIVQGGGIRPSIKKNFPPAWRIVAERSGRLSTHFFQFWLEHFASIKPNGRMVLLLSHEMRKYLINPNQELLQILEDAEVSLHFLHHSEKHELNPLGYSVFSKFESLVQENLESWISKNPDASITPDSLGLVVSPAWQAIDPATISESFKRAGVFPVKSSVFLTESDGSSSDSDSDSGQCIKLARSSQARSYSRHHRPEHRATYCSKPPESLLNSVTSFTSVSHSSLLLNPMKDPTMSPSPELEELEQVQEDDVQDPNIYWNQWNQFSPHQSNIDLDLSTLNSQTLELNFTTIQSENLGFPISKTYFQSTSKPNIDLIDEPEFQNALIPHVKLEIPENEIISVDNLDENCT